MAIHLYKHNLLAYQATASMLATQKKAAIIHPTGTGKSFIAFRFVEDNPQAHFVWLSPSSYIFKTQIESIQRNELNADLSNITFLTYARLMNFGQDELCDLKPDYIILDEFHRCGAQQWGIGVNRLLKAFPDAKIIGLSATSVRFLDNQRDMADELFDGNIASEISLGEAIVRGILPEPQYIEAIYSYSKDLEKYQKQVDSITEKPIHDMNQKYLDELRHSLEEADGIDKIFENYIKDKSGKYIAFCSNVTHMRDMISHVNDWFYNIDPKPHVYAAYSDDPETSKEFAAFKSDKSSQLKLLFCIDMLNEGIHVDGISGVILFRPTVSPIIFMQQIGRALTSGVNSTPLIFDVVNNFDSLCSIGAIEQQMQTAIQGMLISGETDDIKSYHFKVYGQIQNCRDLFKQLHSSLSSGWDQHYAAAKEYYSEHGDLNIPKRYKTSDGLNLGSWISTQRNVHAGRMYGILTEQQITLLDRIGMVWMNRREYNWNCRFQAAKEYFEKNGNLDIPAKYCTHDGINLGVWISNLRYARRTGKKQHLLTNERIAQLDSIGMTWDFSNTHWEKNYAEAVEYFNNNGDLLVPTNYMTKNGIALGKWINYLRLTRSGTINGKALTEDEVERLNIIGMCWEDRNQQQWMQSYQAAKLYYDEHGNLEVPAGYISPEGLALGKWVGRQRYAWLKTDKSNIQLTPERISLLNKIGMVWEKEDSWEHRFKLIKEYYNEHGNLDIPAKYKTDDGIWLGTWLYRQKCLLKNTDSRTKLDSTKRNKLLVLLRQTQQAGR